MIHRFLVALFLVLCFAANASAQFTFSPDTLDFGTVVRGQDRFLYDTITNTSLNYVWLGSLRDLGPSKRIHIVNPPSQPVGFPVGRKYLVTIEYYADSATDEVDTIVVSQYQNGDGQRLIVRGHAIDSVARSVEQIAEKSWLKIDSQPVRGDLRVTFALSRSERVSFTIRDLLGRRVFSDQNYLQVGTHDHLFSTEMLAPGAYVLELRSESFNLSKKFVLIR